MTAKEKIIVALDVPTFDEAARLAAQLADRVSYFKIGLQLFSKCGTPIIDEIKKTGARVFLDLKFHDIPNTVQHAVESACALGVDMLTVHLSGGSQMLNAAMRGAEKFPLTTILGVSVLTSSNEATLREIGVKNTSVEEQVKRLAKLAVSERLGGIVASPLEIKMLRALFAETGASLKIVTPGVRPSWAAANDQQRTLTPRAALEAGADYLVIGRPITAQPDPRAAAQRILDEISEIAN